MRLSHWPCLLHSSFICKIEEEVKKPTLLFEKSRGSFRGGVVHLAHVIHIIGMVGYSKLKNGLIAAARNALVCWRPSLMLTCKHHIVKRTHLLASYPRDFIYSLGFRVTGVFPPFGGHFFRRAREPEKKLRHVVYKIWLVSYLIFSFQIWYFPKWIITSIGQSKHMRVTRFNSLWVSGNTWYRYDWMMIQAFKNMSTQLSVSSVPFIFTGS